MQQMELEVRFIEDVLGMLPKNEEVYQTWVELKQAKQADEEAPAITDERSWTGFPQNENGLFLFDYQFKGFMKEAAAILPSALAVRKKDGGSLGDATMRKRIDNWLFAFPRRLYFQRDGVAIMKPEGVNERPIRCKTMQGDRISLTRSDVIKTDATFRVTLKWLDECPLTEKTIKTWLDYGALKGLGQYRNGGYGKFVYTV